MLTMPSFFYFGRDYFARFLASCREVKLDSLLSFETDRSSNVLSDARSCLYLGGDLVPYGFGAMRCLLELFF